MLLTSERPRTRWLVLSAVWMLVALLAAWHAFAFRDYVELLNRAAPRVPPAVTPLQRIAPTNYADAQTWVRYALEFDRGAPWRVRFTQNDNAPVGREVHWNSAFAHLVATAGRCQAAVTGEPLALATERSLAWLNFPLFLGIVVFFSAWVARRAGAGAGTLVAAGMLGFEAFYGGFSPNYVDHHGILTAAAFGVVLGAVFMGGGWWRAGDGTDGQFFPGSRASARGAAVLSAVSGAIGMWFSAASTIPMIALVGAAGLGAVWWRGRDAQRGGAEFDAGLWRLWARVGAAGSVVFYLFEYAPAHLGWRLEVNHPLYALAWWGGGELVALFAAQHLAGTGWLPRPRWRLAAPLAALAAAPLTIVLGGVSVFVVGDPFVAKIPTTVAEGLSLPAMLRAFGWPVFFSYVNWNLLPLLAAGVLLCRRREPAKSQLLLAGGVALGFMVLLASQVRWAAGASGPQLCLLLVVLASLLHGRSARVRWLVIAGVIAILFVSAAVQRVIRVRQAVAQRLPDQMDLQQLLYRDAAATIRASQPQGEIVLLASPNASTGMGYYGQFRTIGTLYWENYAGLRAAAEIFCATDDATAHARVRARGITHLALISEENFLAQFFAILHPERPPEDLKKTFGYHLLHDQVIPAWLRPVPYRAPPDVSLAHLRVLLLQVVPDQAEWEALWHIARAQLALGEPIPAIETFAAAAARAPAALRLELLQTAGNTCYQNAAPAGAVRFYRAALELGDNAIVAGNLAWLLATAKDDTLRNGPEALDLATRAVRARPDDPATLSPLAAAFAETGRFPEAIATATRALELARAAGNPNVEKELSARVAAYRAGRPWRQ